MKRYLFFTLLALLTTLGYSQTQSADYLKGTWYCTNSSKLKTDVNESVSFTKQSSDSIYCKWLFGNENKFTISLAMLAPDQNGLIKYESPPGNWTVNNDGNEVIIKVNGESSRYEIGEMDNGNLSIKRIE